MSRMLDLLRATTAAAALMVAPHGMASLLGQQPIPNVVRMTGQVAGEQGNQAVPSTDPSPIIQWAIQQGGAFVVVLVILFFYRRDWKTATEYWQAQNAITTNLVTESTKANTDVAAALRENTTVVHQAKNVMQRYLPEGRT
jgi:hypothetical protein